MTRRQALLIATLTLVLALAVLATPRRMVPCDTDSDCEAKNPGTHVDF